MISVMRHRPLCMLAITSLVSGFFIILLLHYVFPFAEHQRTLNTIGLLMDMIGVTYVAYDIFPFTGKEEYTVEDKEMTGLETPEYKAFKRMHTSIGLRLVVMGFFFQILAYWVEELKTLLP